MALATPGTPCGHLADPKTINIFEFLQGFEDLKATTISACAWCWALGAAFKLDAILCNNA
eukprot:4849612-Amphidinium_carterae.1